MSAIMVAVYRRGGSGSVPSQMVEMVRRLGMLRDLLMYVDGSQAGRRRVQFATDLAVRTDARLIGIFVTPLAEMPYLYKPSQVGEVSADLSSKLVLDTQQPRRCSAKSPPGA